MREFYAHRLSIKGNDNLNLHFHFGKLFQKYVVDAYVKVESNNLEFIKNNQKILRVDQYKGLMDHLSHRAEDENLIPGKMFILPSTHQVCFFFLQSLSGPKNPFPPKSRSVLLGAPQRTRVRTPGLLQPRQS